MNDTSIVNHTIPFALQGTCNTRELGGYPTQDGGVTREHACLRSDSLHALTEDDLHFLREYGVGCVVDLRSPSESEKQPCALQGQEWVEYHPMPLYDEVNSNGLQGGMPATMGELYEKLLDNSQKTIAQALRLIAEHSECTVVFNCTAGKDRTGVLAMLLLSLAEVPDEMILADYACTAGYMQPIFEAQRQAMKAYGIEIPDYVFGSRPEDMQRAMTHLKSVWGDAEKYMLTAGLTGAEIDALRKKLRKGTTL